MIGHFEICLLVRPAVGTGFFIKSKTPLARGKKPVPQRNGRDNPPEVNGRKYRVGRPPAGGGSEEGFKFYFKTITFL